MAKLDGEARTTSIGLFNTAEAFRLSAMALPTIKVSSGFAEMPVRFLYYHALELYLKALLRQQHSAAALSKKFVHKIERLLKGAEALGLLITDEDREVFSLMANTNAVVESRYLKTGSKTWPTLGALNRTCGSIRDSVGVILHKNGVPVRL
jgi:HEPN domain-containing protein